METNEEEMHSHRITSWCEQKEESLEMPLSLLPKNLDPFKLRALSPVFSTCVCLMGLLEGKTSQVCVIKNKRLYSFV